MSGEVTWRVPSLSTADDAVELFTDRARCARPDFTVTEESIATVTEICRRLDGMPLAIELAAARVRALSLDDILDGLHDRFRLLTGGARTSMRRQQTLRASVDWSYALLSESERNLFRRLAVFRGGFDLEAAHVVAAGTDVERYDVLDEITLLVDKSLVVAEQSRGHARYRLLETVRQYAMEKLAESHESEVIRRRHFDFYMAMVNDLGTRLRADPGHRRSQPQMQQLLDHAVTEVDNLRAAFASSAELAPDPDLLIKAAYAAAWLVDLVLADRLADAAIRVGGGTDASFIRAYALSFLGRGQEAEAVLAEARAGELSETDDGRLAFLQATNRLFALADPAGAKRLIDRMSRTPARQDRNCVHAFLTVYWAAMGKQERPGSRLNGSPGMSSPPLRRAHRPGQSPSLLERRVPPRTRQPPRNADTPSLFAATLFSPTLTPAHSCWRAGSRRLTTSQRYSRGGSGLKSSGNSSRSALPSWAESPWPPASYAPHVRRWNRLA